MRPHLTVIKQTTRGFSTTEFLLAIAMITVLAGFAVMSVYRRDRAALRTGTAVKIANYLQQARLDSIRRSAKDVDLMAQVKIFDRRTYSIMIDGDKDGYLDVPLIMSLPEQPGAEINGPFPKTFIFDWQGQTVDLQNHRVATAPMTIGNSSAASAIKLSDDGTITVVPAVKLTAPSSK